MLDDFDIGPQSDEFEDDTLGSEDLAAPFSDRHEDTQQWDEFEDTPEMMDVEDDGEYDDGFADEMELGAEDFLSAFDDDPSPYDGTYSEM